MDLLERKTYRHFPCSQYAWTEISFAQISLSAFVSGHPSINEGPHPLMHNLTTNNVLARIMSLFRRVPSSRDLKILSREDSIWYVCMERPFRKVHRLQPRAFGHKCASVMIQLSKGYDQSRIPCQKGNFLT